MSSDKKIPLMEVFGPTVQGEGAVIGQQTYFMRFGLCDYKCTLCDSMHAVDPKLVKANARWLTQDEIAHEFYDMHKYGSAKWVTLSGGNPCIHDLDTLVNELHSRGFKTAVETQGTLCPDWLDNCDVVTISPKGPGIGENTDFDVLDSFVEKIKAKLVNFKIVVFDQRDLEFVKLVHERYQYTGYPFYLSQGNPWPPGVRMPDTEMTFASLDTVYVMAQIRQYKVLLEDIMTDPILSQMRFLPQWHTFLWGNEKGK